DRDPCGARPDPGHGLRVVETRRAPPAGVRRPSASTRRASPRAPPRPDRLQTPPRWRGGSGALGAHPWWASRPGEPRLALDPHAPLRESPGSRPVGARNGPALRAPRHGPLRLPPPPGRPRGGEPPPRPRRDVRSLRSLTHLPGALPHRALLSERRRTGTPFHWGHGYLPSVTVSAQPPQAPPALSAAACRSRCDAHRAPLDATGSARRALAARGKCRGSGSDDARSRHAGSVEARARTTRARGTREVSRLGLGWTPERRAAYEDATSSCAGP